MINPSPSLRAELLSSRGITFYASEAGLHEGSEMLGSARACHQLETVVVLRDATERARSHIAEIIRVYPKYVPYIQSDLSIATDGVQSNAVLLLLVDWLSRTSNT